MELHCYSKVNLCLLLWSLNLDSSSIFSFHRLLKINVVQLIQQKACRKPQSI